MIGIVCSRADEASEHITEQLLAIGDWTEHVDEDWSEAAGGGTVYRTEGAELRTFEDLHLYLDDAAAPFDDIDWLAFASRHSGDTGPLLTAHVTGNFGEAEYGGETGELAEAAPAAMSAVVDGLVEHAPDEYEVGIECTHHGPSTVGVPSMFVELGSGPEEWGDEAGATAVAKAILDACFAAPYAPAEGENRRHIVGFGGGHYAPRFTRIVRETDWHVGHVAADWCLDAMGAAEESPERIDRAFEQSVAAVAVIDGEHPELVETIESLGYQVRSETWLRETGGVPLPLVEQLETELCAVEDGLRFGEVAVDYDGDVVVESLPTAVIAETRAIDADTTRQAVEEHAVAFETREAGNRLGARAAFRKPADRTALIDALVDILDRSYEVERDADTVVVHESTFSPERAAELGVPEGPKYGQLSNGHPVTIDGQEIEPADVTVERTRRLQID